MPEQTTAAAALQLYARLLQCHSLAAAAQSLVVSLAHDFGLARASLGWHTRGRTRLLASTGIDRVEAAGELSEQLVGAMDEALEQAQTLAWPLATDGTGCAVGAGGAIGAERAGHAGGATLRFELHTLQRTLGGAVATVPLGSEGDACGCFCAERSSADAGFTAAELQRLEQTLQLAAPALRWMQRAEWPWYRRAGFDLQQTLQQLRQPQHRWRRRLLLGAATALAAAALLPLQHEVAGRARLEGAEQRVLVAPSDGFVKAAHVRPGDRVAAGAPLLQLVEDDLHLERERWSSQLAQHENAYAAAMAGADRVGTATSMARVSEAQAQLALVEERLQRGRLTAPFDAVVIAGDLSQAIGAPVRQGDVLLTLASGGQQRVIVEIDETDIARVHPGQSGQLSLSSLAWHSEDLVVERITPMARAVDGRNIFEVQARLVASAAAPSAALRPGLLGRATLVVGRRPPLWVWLGSAANRARLAWWSFFG